jgi:hypothetical protein
LNKPQKSTENTSSCPNRGAKRGALESTGAQKLDVDALAAVLLGLTPADRARLAANLSGPSEADAGMDQ